MKIIKIVLLATAVLVITYFGFFSKRQEIPATPAPKESMEKVKETTFAPFEAEFKIYTNGTLRIFTDPRYHNKSESIYITANNPSTITVAKPNQTWGDFFETLPMKLEDECLTTGTGQLFCINETNSLKFYVNGLLVSSALNQEIQPNDQLLVSYGVKNEDVSNQLAAFE